MLIYKKTESSNNTIIINDVPPSVNFCNCCREDIDSIDMCKLSCGHMYHYDCIYYAFCANKKRSVYVLECPYCRKKVNPLPEKDQFPFDNFIHGSGNCKNMKMNKNNNSLIFWGKGYCSYKNGSGLYCNSDNAMYGREFCYCFSHRNVAHLGENYCKYKTSLRGNYCNLFLHGNSTSTAFCKNHLNSIECSEIIKTGKKKGTICGVINCKRHVVNNESKKNGSVNSIKIVELNEDPISVQNPITVYKSLNESLLSPPCQLTLTVSQLEEIRNLLNILKSQVAEKDHVIINTLLDKYFYDK